MDFKTHSDENGTKTFPKLEEAFEYAEDNDDVEKISFVLPTDEKVVLTKGLLGWEYDPIENADKLTPRDTEVLELSIRGRGDDAKYTSRQWKRVAGLIKKGLIEVVKEGIEGTPDYFTSRRGLIALTDHHLTPKR